MNIGFQELLLISVLALIILGPERLPSAVRTFTLWASRLKATINQIKQDIGKEINIDEIRRDVYNEELMRTLDKKRSNTNENTIIDPSIKNTHDENYDPYLDGDEYLEHAEPSENTDNKEGTKLKADIPKEPRTDST